MSDDMYVKALQDQCAEWERMYDEMKAERDMWKSKAEGAEKEASEAKRQIRHV